MSVNVFSLVWFLCPTEVGGTNFYLSVSVSPVLTQKQTSALTRVVLGCRFSSNERNFEKLRLKILYVNSRLGLLH